LEVIAGTTEGQTPGKIKEMLANSLVFPRTHVVSVSDGRSRSRCRCGRLRSTAASYSFRWVTASATSSGNGGGGDALGYRGRGGRRFVYSVRGGPVAPVIPVHRADVNDGRHALFPRQRQ